MIKMDKLRTVNAQNQRELDRLNAIIKTKDSSSNEQLSDLMSQLSQLKRKHVSADSDKIKAEEKNRARIKSLEHENQRLMQELSSFDLEFFEQLEDLKYNYSEAKQKLELRGHTGLI